MICDWYNINIRCEVFLFTISHTIVTGKFQATAAEDTESGLLEFTWFSAEFCPECSSTVVELQNKLEKIYASLV